MTQENEIYQAIREICNTDNPQRFAEMNKTVFEVAKKALELSQSSFPSNLDEAAESYATESAGWNPDGTETYQVIQEEVDAFKAGAKWRDSHILKMPNNLDEAAEINDGQLAQIIEDYSPATYDFIESETLFLDKEEAIELARTLFKSGAKWMAEQGVVTEQVVGETPIGGKNGVIVLLHDFDGIKAGDKVIVQIRKL